MQNFLFAAKLSHSAAPAINGAQMVGDHVDGFAAERARQPSPSGDYVRRRGAASLAVVLSGTLRLAALLLRSVRLQRLLPLAHRLQSVDQTETVRCITPFAHSKGRIEEEIVSCLNR
jgi:hypothetical protein